MLENISSAFKAHLYDRISSPLSGAFLFSWPAWNWKFLLILFSDLAAPEKIVYISLNIYPSNKSILTYAILYPALTATAFIAIYPIPALWAYIISQRHKKIFKTTQQQTEDTIPLPQEEAIHLRRLLRESQRSHEELIAKNETEIAELRNSCLKEAETSERAKEENLNLQLANNSYQQKIEASDLQLETLRNSRHAITLFLSSCIPTISGTVRDNQNNNYTIIKSEKKFHENFFELDIKQTDEEKYIESNLKAFITKHSLFINNPTKLYAIGGLILFKTNRSKLQDCIIGNYFPGSEDRAISQACILLSDLSLALGE